jgi:hypothetical protein
MTLNQLGTPLLPQAPLFQAGHDQSSNTDVWEMAPDGLACIMNRNKPQGFPIDFAWVQEPNGDALSRRLCWITHHYGFSPHAAVQEQEHWIVVRGFDADRAPAGPDDIGYTISGIYVNNPFPCTPSPGPPPPHSPNDDCGTGGLRGIANEHIAYSFWLSTYMVAVPRGDWAGQYVAICEAPSNARRKPRSEPRSTVTATGRTLLPEDAADYAMQRLRESGLPQRPEWREALSDVTPHAPLLVHRLDRAGADYYIVPAGRSPNAATAAVAIDSETGTYLEAAGAGAGGSLLFLDAAGARAALAAKDPDFPWQDVLLENVPPDLVWKSCKESRSPFYPFYRFAARSTEAYVRTDGRVFMSLTDGKLGR